MLHRTSALARPRSASRRTTDLPAEASWTARLTATLDLPTPPLPEVTAITEARGRWRTRERRLEAWSRRVMRDLRSRDFRFAICDLRLKKERRLKPAPQRAFQIANRKSQIANSLLPSQDSLCQLLWFADFDVVGHILAG